MKRIILIIFAISLVFTCYADEIIVGFENEDLPVVNENFRKLRDNTRDNASDILWEEDTEVELKTATDIDFQQKEAKQFVIENRTSDPSSPVTGELWLRTDL